METEGPFHRKCSLRQLAAGTFSLNHSVLLLVFLVEETTQMYVANI